MHPSDVHDRLSTELPVLAESLARRADASTTLSAEGVHLYIPLSLPVRRAEAVPYGAHLPGGGPGQLMQRTMRIPILGSTTTKEALLHVDASNFDGDPPAAELLRPDRTPLRPSEWPKDPLGTGIVSGHPIFKRPFFCRPGLREYHSHIEHEDDPWDSHREGFSLARTISRLIDDLYLRWPLE